MSADFCPRGHATPTAAHRDSQGSCKQCKRDYDRHLKTRMRAAYAVCRGLEDRGIRFEDGGVPLSADDVAEQLIRIAALPDSRAATE